MDLKSKLYAEINELRNKSDSEIRAILKARDDLKNSLEYMLLLTKEACAQEKQKLYFVKAHNPQLEKEFVINNLLQTGYPSLILILESIVGDDPVKKGKVYWEKVNEEFESRKSKFIKTLTKSGDKNRLIGGEIKTLEELLFGETRFSTAENEQVQIGDNYFKVSDIKYYRKLYQKLIVKGERDYHLTQITEPVIRSGPGDFFHVKVEVFAKFLSWLRELQILQANSNTTSKKFYKFEDFEDLRRELLQTESFRIKDLLQDHLEKSSESIGNFCMALRKYLLIDCEYKEPTSYSEHGYATEDNTNPDQINIAYLWIRNRQNEEVKRINLDTNPELYKAELTEQDYKDISEKLRRIEEHISAPDKLKPQNIKDFEKSYRDLLFARKTEYEDIILAKKNRKKGFSIRQICLIHFYEERPIEKKDKGTLSIKYGYSGDKLYITYLKIFNDDQERQKPTRQNIADLKKVSESIDGKARLRLLEDLKEAEAIFSQKK